MYNYDTQKKELCTDSGQRMFLKIRDNVQHLLKTSGAFQMEKAWKDCYGGSSWDMLACVDRLLELGEIKEISNQGCAAQHRVFVKNF